VHWVHGPFTDALGGLCLRDSVSRPFGPNINVEEMSDSSWLLCRFLLQSGIPQTFCHTNDFSVFQSNLIQLALSIGAVIGTILNPFQGNLYLRSANRNSERQGRSIPEARLYFSVPGSLIFTVGLFWYGWSVNTSSKCHWVVPTLGIGAVGLGI
jgi:hypothetical protein